MKREDSWFDHWLEAKLKKPKFRKAFEIEELRSRLAIRIVELRQRKSISQKQLAERIGTTQQALSAIETFRQDNITLLTLQKIARALGSELVVELR